MYAVRLASQGTDGIMPSHNQPTSITASATNVMSDVKRRAKPGKLPRQNFTVGQALLQAFQSSLRKKDTSSIAGKAAASAGSGVNIDEKQMLISGSSVTLRAIRAKSSKKD